MIDLAGINYNSAGFTESYNSAAGVLTVNDGTDSATLTFDNFTGEFKFATDGSGGTDIYDPPANSNASVSVGHDQFVFHQNHGDASRNPGAPSGPSAPDHINWANGEDRAH